jgi:hypothetical protein
VTYFKVLAGGAEESYEKSQDSRPPVSPMELEPQWNIRPLVLMVLTQPVMIHGLPRTSALSVLHCALKTILLALL